MSFICPRCKTALNVSTDEARCSKDGLVFQRVDGIWRFLLPERESHYERFIADYEAVRRFEGRGSPSAEYYRALPFKDLSGAFTSDWKIRAASFERLTLTGRFAESLLHSSETILDLGAGNGWLSNRLSALGHQVYAVDLLVNPQDGLGAWTQYENLFTPVQAEFMRLPFPDKSVSLVIYNASFHYSENYEETLSEALCVLAPNGRVIVMDSPVYHSAESGQQMIAERKSNFLVRYGFASDSLQSENYFTYARMSELGERLGIRWQHIRPFYGIRWTIRPWLAHLRGLREPAEFGLWVGIPR
jgi:SAM-dependent methyltransferase